MSELSFWGRFLLAAIATWRLSHLLSREDGPGAVIARLRVRLGSGPLAGLLDCFYCVSIWVALPLAFVVARTPVDLFLTWLALSGSACLLERLGSQPVEFHPLPESANDGMLWTEQIGGEGAAELLDPGHEGVRDGVAARVDTAPSSGGAGRQS